MTNTNQTASLDDLIAHHTKQAEESSANEDVYEAAKLFNAVGSQLIGIDKMNVGDGPPAMKLNKQTILNEQKQNQQAAYSPSPQVQPRTPPQSPTPPASHMNVNTPVVSVDVNTYNKHLKKVETLSKKITKLEKEFVKTLEIINVDKKTCSYKLVTDDVEMVCRDTCSLLSVISNQINSKVDTISITKC